MLDDPEVGTPEVGAAIAEDPSVAAMVLRVANSSAYELREPVADIQRAAVVLGQRQLWSIVLRVAVIRQLAHLPPSADLDLIELWRHSILTAQVAQGIGSMARARWR